jgi:predicted transcriptional regulator
MADKAKKPPMTGAEFKRAVKSAGLSVYAAADFLGLSRRQAYRISAGEYEAPVAVGKLLRLMVRKKLTAAEVDDAQ